MTWWGCWSRLVKCHKILENIPNYEQVKPLSRIDVIVSYDDKLL